VFIEMTRPHSMQIGIRFKNLWEVKVNQYSSSSAFKYSLWSYKDRILLYYVYYVDDI